MTVAVKWPMWCRGQTGRVHAAARGLVSTWGSSGRLGTGSSDRRADAWLRGRIRSRGGMAMMDSSWWQVVVTVRLPSNRIGIGRTKRHPAECVIAQNTLELATNHTVPR